MNGALWTGNERYKLLMYAEQCSQKEAARRLGRTLEAVKTQVKSLKIVWRGGCVSIEKIAAELNCSPGAVSRVVRALASEMKNGRAQGTRYHLDTVEAERVKKIVARQLARRPRHRIAGRMGAAARREQRDQQ